MRRIVFLFLASFVLSSCSEDIDCNCAPPPKALGLKISLINSQGEDVLNLENPNAIPHQGIRVQEKVGQDWETLSSNEGNTTTSYTLMEQEGVFYLMPNWARFYEEIPETLDLRVYWNADSYHQFFITLDKDSFPLVRTVDQADTRLWHWDWASTTQATPIVVVILN